MFWSSRVEVTIYLFFLPGLRSRRFSGGVGIRRTLRVGIVYPIAEVQSNYFLHCTPKLEILTRACWNGTISYETFIETENSCCAQRFPLIDSRYKIVDSQASFTLCQGVGNFGKVGVGAFYLRHHNVDYYVRRHFSWSGSVEMLHILFWLLTMQCKWGFTKLYTFCPISLCWLSLNSPSFVWNAFYTSTIRNPFLKINYLTSIFRALSTNKS